MPWSHCSKTVMDDQRCPECGISKVAWTVKVDLTRVFRLSKPWPGDLRAQIETLKAAADQGTPFCEQCERAKKKAQAFPEAPYEGDGEAQAEVLKNAAEDGSPFCEKCEKERQRQEQEQEQEQAASA